MSRPVKVALIRDRAFFDFLYKERASGGIVKLGV